MAKFTQDQIKGAQDALNAIIASRQGQGQMPPLPPIGGEINVEIDPNLNQPKNKNKDQQNQPDVNMEIFDPNGVLNKLKNKDNEIKQQQKKSDTIYHGPDDPKNKNNGEQNSQGGKQDQQNQQGQQGQQGQQSDQSGSQGKQDKQDQGQSGGSGSDQGEKGKPSLDSKDKQGKGSSADEDSDDEDSDFDEDEEEESADEQAKELTSGEKAKQSAQAARNSANDAQNAAENAQNLADTLKNSGSNKAGKAQESADKIKEKAEQAAQMADEATKHASAAEKAEAAGDEKTAQSEANKAENAMNAANKAAKEAVQEANKSAQAARDESEQKFTDGWNNVLSKLDNDNVTDEELEEAKEDIENNNSIHPSMKQGMLDAIQAIKQSRSTPFEIDQETADEFKNKGMMLPKNTKIKEYDDSDEEETEAEHKARLDKIEKELSGEKGKEILQQLQTDNKMKQLDKEAEKEKVAQATQNTHTPANMSNFEHDLYLAVQSQVTDREEDFTIGTYYKPNPLSQLTGMAHQGQIYPETKGIPTIVVFFDQSGSWDYSDIQKGKEALKAIEEFQINGQIEIVLKYFANHVHDEPQTARWEQGTHAFPEILDTIVDLQADNVVILSDRDITSQTNFNYLDKVEVPGVVWWLWRNSRGDENPDYLTGASGNFEYWLA